MKETCRVLMIGGQVLVANFCSHSFKNGRIGPLFGQMSVPNAKELDTEMSRYGLQPVVPTEMVVKPDRKATIYGVYGKKHVSL